MANTLGMPRGYDIGPMRVHWFGSYVTDWIGDDAYLHYLSGFFTAPLFLWDIFRMSGEVVRKESRPKGPAVDFDLHGTNGQGQSITFGHATAVLESRQHKM